MTHLLPTLLVGIGPLGARVVRYAAREVDAIDRRVGALVPALIVAWRPGDEITRDEPVETWPDGGRRFHFHVSDEEAAEFDYPLDPEATIRISAGRRFEDRCAALGKVLRDLMSVALDYESWRKWIDEIVEPDHLAVAQRDARLVVVGDVTEPRTRQMFYQVIRHVGSALVPDPVLLQLVAVGMSRSDAEPSEQERGEEFCASLVDRSIVPSTGVAVTLWHVDDTTSTGSHLKPEDLVDWLQQAVVLAVCPSVGEETRARVFSSPSRAPLSPQSWALGGWFCGISLGDVAVRVLVATGERFAKAPHAEITPGEMQATLTAEKEFLDVVGPEGVGRAVATAAGLSLTVAGPSTSEDVPPAGPIALAARLPEPPALRDVPALSLDEWDDALDRAEVAYGFAGVGEVISGIRSAAASYAERMTGPAGGGDSLEATRSPESIAQVADRYILSASTGCLKRVKALLAEASRLALVDLWCEPVDTVSLPPYRDAIRKRLDRQPHATAYVWRVMAVSLLFGYVAWQWASGLGPGRQNVWGIGAGALALVAGVTSLSLAGRRLLAALARYRRALADCARAAVQADFERQVSETVERIRGAVDAEGGRIDEFERILQEQTSRYRAHLVADGPGDTVLVKRTKCNARMKVCVDNDVDIQTRLCRRLVDERFLQPWREMDADNLRRSLWTRLVEAARAEDIPKPHPDDVIPAESLTEARKASEELPLLCRVRDRWTLDTATVTHVVARGMRGMDEDAAMTTWCGMVGALARARAEIRE